MSNNIHTLVFLIDPSVPLFATMEDAVHSHDGLAGY